MSILSPRFGAVLGLLSLVVILRGEKIVSDESQDDLYLKAVLVNYDDFVEDKLVTLCRKTLVAERQRRLTWLKIGVAPSDLEEPTAEVHATFERWRALNSSFGKRTWHRADLVALNGNAVLRIRSGNEIRKIVLEGSDPLIWSVRNQEFEILHFWFGAPQFRVRQERIGSMAVWARTTTPPTEVACRELLGTLSRHIYPVVRLCARTDHWFVSRGTGFPIFYWFAAGTPPTELEHDRAASKECIQVSGRVKCY